MILVRSALISSFLISLVAASVVTSSLTNNPLAIPEFSAATTPLTFSTSFITSRPTEYGYIAGNGHFSLFPSSLQGTGTPILPYSAPSFGARTTAPIQTSLAAVRPLSTGTNAMTGCPASCERRAIYSYYLYWRPLAITATITAETVILIVNGVSNTTRTTVVTNTEVDLRNSTLVSNTNSAGTQTARIEPTHGEGFVAHTIAFPTGYDDGWPLSYSLCGTLSTTINGAGTCIRQSCDTASGEIGFAFPSPRSASLYTQTGLIDLGFDPKGLTYEPAWEEIVADDYLSERFPDLGYWTCQQGPWALPEETHSTALYLTATSTSTESEDGAYAPTHSRSLPSPDEEAVSTRELHPSESAAEVASILAKTKTQKDSLSKPAPDVSVETDVYGSDSLRTQAVSTDIAPSHLLATSYSTAVETKAAATAPADIAVSSTNINGDIVGSTAQSLAVVITSINAPGSSSAVIPVIKASTTMSDETTPIILISGPSISTNVNSQYLTSGQALAPGSPISVVSEAATTKNILHTTDSQTVLIVASFNSTILASPTALQALMTGDQIASSNTHDRNTIQDQTLVPSVPITLSTGTVATPILLQTSNSDAVLSKGPSLSSGLAAATGPQPFTIEAQVVSANGESQYIVGSQTLTPGIPITLGSDTAATPIQLQTTSSNTILVVGSSTSTIVAAAAEAQPITSGARSVSADTQNQDVSGSQTLTAGGAVTVSGTPVSLAPSDTQIVGGTSTQGIGGYIVSGLRGGPSASSTGTVASKGSRGRCKTWRELGILVVITILVMAIMM